MKPLVTLALTICMIGCGDKRTPDAANVGMEIDRERVAGVVQKIASEFEHSYLFPDKGKEVAEALRMALQRGEYVDITSGRVLAGRLTDDLRRITDDGHATVYFGTRGRLNPVLRTASRRAMDVSAGFERVDRLRGNIGYIKLQLFSHIRRFQGNANAAMRLLEDTDALIIDLRDTPGGDGNSAAYLCSFFVDPDKPVHLLTFYNQGRAPIESWTTRLPKAYLNNPVYVLTSRFTASAAEAFTYVMRILGRVIIVGETTGGGAHSVRMERIDKDFSVLVPTGRAESPITKSNWEGTGVAPHLPATAKAALAVAVTDYLERAISNSDDPAWTKVLQGLLDDVSAKGEQVLFAYVPLPPQQPYVRSILDEHESRKTRDGTHP